VDHTGHFPVPCSYLMGPCPSLCLGMSHFHLQFRPFRYQA
jgi:hypothetical protein